MAGRGWKGTGGICVSGLSYDMIIIDETVQEEESDTTKNEGHEKRTDGTKIGGRWDGMEKEERRIQQQ